MPDGMKTFKVLGALLAYPSAELIEALPELERALDAEGLLAARERRAVARMIDEMRRHDLMTLQERYVDLFDRSRALSLHLFEHVHGESRDRGQAMVDLGRLYASHGFVLAGGELPDFLPAVLEFASCRPLTDARALLADMAHILQALGGRLSGRAPGYCGVFAALVVLAGEEPEFDAARAAHGHEGEDESIDEAWAEPPAFGACSDIGAGAATVAPVRFYRKGAVK